MATDNKRGNREAEKPKAAKVKTNALAPFTKSLVAAKPAPGSKK